MLGTEITLEHEERPEHPDHGWVDKEFVALRKGLGDWKTDPDQNVKLD